MDRHDTPNVLLVSDDRGTIIVLKALLERLGATIHVAATPDAAATLIDASYHWVIIDPSTDPESRVTFMANARNRGARAEFIVMKQMHDLEGLLEVMGYSMAA